MSGFAAVIELSALDGTDGFQVNGVLAGDLAGASVASAGDVNGDGYEDFIIGAFSADTNGNNSGASYLVFGKAGGFPANFELSSLDGTNGFRIDGAAAFQSSGWSVSSAGDLNGDGYDDLFIGAPNANPGSLPGAGGSFVVFGKASGFTATLNLANLDGSNGFKINGEATFDASGRSLASAGDVNGDGYDDLIIGAAVADSNGADAGASYVVFGKAGGFGSSLDLSSLTGANGFKVTGGAANDRSGTSVASAGDINGDGYDDLIIGAKDADPHGYGSGAAYVVFGKAGGFSASLSVTALNGTNGFKISGETVKGYVGNAVASAGDINGDGYDDLIVGGRGSGGGSAIGAAYVVFGKASGFAANIDLSSLDGSNGFKIPGSAVSDNMGYSVSSAGDVNGDGYDDLIVGAIGAAGNFRGASYVVFGKASGFTASFAVSSLDGTNGFMIRGENAYGYSGQAVAAGDINGDGYDDLIVGALGGNAHGSNTGAAYIIYGHASGDPVVNFTGGAGNDAQDGGAGADTLSGGGGKDVLNGLGGADIINGDDGNDTLSGGDGDDTLDGGTGNDIVSGDAGDDSLTGGEGNDKLFGGDGADHLTGGNGADQLLGGDGDDIIDGGAGNDTMDGGAGADAMSGGDGNDIYYVDDVNDTTIELAGGGTDVVRASISWTLSANVEQLELQGAGNLDGTGNELNNRLTGNSGDNVLSGLAGSDTILGGDGADTLIGGTGNDLMTGGAGADTFVILPESVYSSKAPAGGKLEIDFVYDLKASEGDKLDLSAIDADLNTTGDQAFTLVRSFDKHAGEMTLVYSASTGQTVLSLDVDGDGKADYQMKITGDVHLDSGGWIL